MPKTSKSKLYETQHKLCLTEGELNYHLIPFGDYIAKKEGYERHTGIDALHFYLIQKYHWLPSQVKSMSHDDLHFVLAEEKQGWTLPKEAIFNHQ